jgi:predicted phage terminase large subunit-like protein
MAKIAHEELILLKFMSEEYRRYLIDDLAEYARFMWDIVEPKRDYVHNWHIDAICEHLQAVSNFEIENLVISMPPRHMKSLLIAVFWQTWVWLKKPESRWIFSSYASNLSIRDAVKARRLIQHPRYQATFKPDWKFSNDENMKTRFSNDALGYRITTSVGGAGTGEGGDFIVVDDALKASDAHSENMRNNVSTWWNEEMSNRANDPKRVGRVIVMQRLHEDDLAGMCLKSGDYEELKLPAEFTGSTRVTSIGWSDPRVKDGELLWPDRFDSEWIAKEKRKLGSYASSSQLQQDPVPKGGGLFKRLWWKFYTELPKTKITLAQFWDCAQKPGITNDFSVCATWLKSINGYYLVDLYRDKLETPDLERAIVCQFLKFKPNAVVIEDKSAGSSVIQYVRRNQKLIPIIPYDPGSRDKVSRAAAATPMIESGNAYLPAATSWLEDFLMEHQKFPNDTHDDQVDTTSMMVDYFNINVDYNPRARSL